MPAVLDATCAPAAPRAPTTDLRRPMLVVAATAVVSLIIDGLAVVSGPASLQTVALVTSVVVALLYAGFWVLSAWLIDPAAVAMGARSKRRELLARTASAYPILLLYPLLSLVQVLTARTGAADLAVTLGWLALPALGWFLARGVGAIAATYEIGTFNAVSLALLPYAVMTAALLVMILLVSGLHAGQVI